MKWNGVLFDKSHPSIYVRCLQLPKISDDPAICYFSNFGRFSTIWRKNLRSYTILSKNSVKSTFFKNFQFHVKSHFVMFEDLYWWCSFLGSYYQKSIFSSAAAVKLFFSLEKLSTNCQNAFLLWVKIIYSGKLELGSRTIKLTL